MALPPRGDPRRPLHLAVWTARFLAAAFLLFGACGLAPQFYLLAQGGGQYASVAALGIAGSMFYFLPGGAYVVFAVYLRQHRFWAVVAALVLAGRQALMFLLGTVLMWVYFREGLAWAVLIPIALMGVVLLALAVLIYLLARLFAAIRHPPYGREERGFEPLGCGRQCRSVRTRRSCRRQRSCRPQARSWARTPPRNRAAETFAAVIGPDAASSSRSNPYPILDPLDECADVTW